MSQPSEEEQARADRARMGLATTGVIWGAIQALHNIARLPRIRGSAEGNEALRLAGRLQDILDGG